MILTNFLYNSAKPKTIEVQPLESPTHCAISGEEIVEGVPIKKVVSSATGSVADFVRFDSAYVSLASASVFKAPTIYRGNFLALKDRFIAPFVSSTSATDTRPCWRDLIFSLEMGIECVAVFSDESKRRLWPYATVSYFGESWQPFLNASEDTLHYPGISKPLSINVYDLRECLLLVEHVYGIGFSKRSIVNGLYSDYKNTKDFGIAETARYEEVLRRWRYSDEFLLSVFISQKKKENKQ